MNVATGGAKRNPLNKDDVPIPAPVGAEELARRWHLLCAGSHAFTGEARVGMFYLTPTCLPATSSRESMALGFVRPSGAERDAGQPGPRVPLRSTRGYSPRPLRGQGAVQQTSKAPVNGYFISYTTKGEDEKNISAMLPADFHAVCYISEVCEHNSLSTRVLWAHIGEVPVIRLGTVRIGGKKMTDRILTHPV